MIPDMKIVSIVGARPQFIKAAMLSRVIGGESDIRHVQLHTGQHYSPEMTRILFNDLDYHPDYDLGVGSGSHAVQTGRAMIGIEEALVKEKPSLVVIYGDTNTTLAGALAASKLQIPIAHVEAGLRSFNRRMPEEINRIVADSLSDLLFCPTENALNNLRKEGRGEGVTNTGDILLDTLELFLPVARESSGIIERLSLKNESFWLLTMHRPANVDEECDLKEVLAALAETRHPKIIFPSHPRTAETLRRVPEKDKKHIEIIPPVSYHDVLLLEENAELILTDSGGVQREAYFLSRPCLTLREETEWPETLEKGWNKLVGSSREGIKKGIESLSKPRAKPDLKAFGGGNAGLAMVEEIKKTARIVK